MAEAVMTDFIKELIENLQAWFRLSRNYLVKVKLFESIYQNCVNFIKMY